MVGCSRGSLPTWMTAAASRVDLSGGVAPSHQGSPSSTSSSTQAPPAAGADTELGMVERALSAAGAAFISAVIVNPLDVAKAQAAGVLYHHPPQMAVLGPDAILSEFKCSASCTRGIILGSEPVCPPDCFQYKGTLDLFLKVVRQEGFGRLWRGTNAGLALAVPTVGIYLPCYDIFRNWIEDFTRSNAPGLTPYAPPVAGSVARSLACIACSPIELARTRMQAYKEFRPGVKPPGMWKTLAGVLSPLASSSQNVQNYRVLWTGVGAQLARDVPFSAICWSTLEPIRRKLLGLVGEEGNAGSVLGANFAAGFVAGSLAAGATCPLDVAKTRRQIEKDTEKAMRMTTRQTLTEIWSSGGLKGLFTGVSPRVARAGPSVGIVISFYEVVKYALHQRQTS
ncbi:mitochondrial carrier protein MTM1-like isoform X2 [Phragmites australis]|uniref:mitochondrial carrier protein MTM1-like isoform X2 n=1 Tax=Phragmites australis TaxID=29695 RepID=UPI002D769E86|nr:mitochondrial carrier protein MTM1-like isoform X2 [Phragmites australis]